MKIKPITIANQAFNIKGMYKDAIVNTIQDKELQMVLSLKPSPLADIYKIKLLYNISSTPSVYVLEPKPLSLAKGKIVLPHCYDTPKQKLCLYYPKTKEWNKNMLLSKTIIPWAFDWLYHYEIWLATGNWTGGGIHPANNKLKQAS
jgi:hypothetical protein